MNRTLNCFLAISLVFAVGCGSSTSVTVDEKPRAPQFTASNDHIKPLIKRIVASQFDVKLSELDLNTPLSEVGNKSNFEFNLIEVVGCIERTYRIEIWDEHFKKKKSRGLATVHKQTTTAKICAIVQESIHAGVSKAVAQERLKKGMDYLNYLKIFE